MRRKKERYEVSSLKLFTPSQKERLKTIASDQDISFSELIRRQCTPLLQLAEGGKKN